MAFKMKGPGLPGFRKQIGRGFYKQNPLDVTNSDRSPILHEKADHYKTPHDNPEDQSMHALQTRRDNKLSQFDYTTTEDILGKGDDIDGDGEISKYEELKARERTIDVKVRDKYTLTQQQTMINNSRRRHFKAYRNHLKTQVDGDGDLPPGMAWRTNNAGEKVPYMKNQIKFDKYADRMWIGDKGVGGEADKNSLGWAYPNVYGQTTTYEDRTPNIAMNEIQMTNSEAIQFHIGGAIEGCPKDANGNVKEFKYWTKREKDHFEAKMQEHRQLVADNIRKDGTADLKSDIRVSIADRLTPEFITKHATREKITPEVVKREGLQNIGTDQNPKWYYSNDDGSVNMKHGPYVPKNAWSSSAWGKVMADEVGFTPDQEEYWAIGDVKKEHHGVKTKKERQFNASQEGEVVGDIHSTYGVGETGGPREIVTKGDEIFEGTEGVGTEGIIMVQQPRGAKGPSGGPRYHYRDASGKVHNRITYDQMLEIKTGMSANEREALEAKKQLDAETKVFLETDKQNKINSKKLANQYFNSEPNEDEFKEKYGVQFDTDPNSREFKKYQKNFNKAYNKWWEKAENKGVDMDVLSDLVNGIVEVEEENPEITPISTEEAEFSKLKE
jgi:hypothetical protein